ncbi:uncharacterized protein LOC103568604 isoform X1 [Microplitis demolitor]|uniref:uncharacterized protein LOC103568604 isoform X1 n=1 Tax=Microplitis demolitor TaxID=69319 RepID=UPI0004CD5213|nr:uncharacterized protein LOC103568604 isoform X1 [Microplitis demolitor]
MDGRLSLGINVSIITILIIFAVILVLPLRMLLDTNYEDTHANTLNNNTDNDSNGINDTNEYLKPEEKIIDYAKLKLCPYNYEFIVDSIFTNNYDQNCTYKNVEPVRNKATKINKTEKENTSSATNLSSPSFRIIRPKSVPVTDYILMIMLVFSIIGAFAEYLCIRFMNTQNPPSSIESTWIPRRQSIVDLMLPRKHVSREQFLKTQMSLDVPMGLQRSTVRVSGTSTPPLIRRSSFPVAFVTKDYGLCDSATPPRSPRRPSTSNNIYDNEFLIGYHRSRLIRRH